MELLKNLELVEVELEDKKAVLTFLDEDRGEIREVSWNKQAYKDGKWVDDEDKAVRVDGWAQEYFNIPFDKLTQAIGEKRDVYVYDNFNSLYEVQMVAKFDEDMVGQIIEGIVESVEDNGVALIIKFGYGGETYQSKMGYSLWLENRREYFANPQKKVKQLKKFEEKFHIPFEQKDKLVGQKVMVEVKRAFGRAVYNEIKPLLKKK